MTEITPKKQIQYLEAARILDELAVSQLQDELTELVRAGWENELAIEILGESSPDWSDLLPSWQPLVRTTGCEVKSVDDAIRFYVLPESLQICESVRDGVLDTGTAILRLEELNLKFGHPEFLRAFCSLCSLYEHRVSSDESTSDVEREIMQEIRKFLEVDWNQEPAESFRKTV